MKIGTMVMAGLLASAGLFSSYAAQAQTCQEKCQEYYESCMDSPTTPVWLCNQARTQCLSSCGPSIVAQGKGEPPSAQCNGETHAQVCEWRSRRTPLKLAAN